MMMMMMMMVVVVMVVTVKEPMKSGLHHDASAIFL
jgi:hypothetical protein